ncbi:diguanylate cyclase [Halospina denitrificans]|uniref:diguanylate cyclase n=1 Tax=Halospina denitrificans TaxID=332522 RepID=A0A4R7K1B8_9GAMM|nr:diguanylate cyclase [Halospina denitrificans]TDT44375.1 diguanylate cyclase [Halospina denitrificans]
MSHKYRLLAMLWLCLAVLPAFGAEPAHWRGTEGSLELEGYTYSWVDRGGDASLDEVMGLADDQWRAESPPAISHGYVDHPYWFRIALKNPTEQRLRPYFEIGYPVLRHIEFYRIHDHAPMEKLLLGNERPFEERPLEHRNFIVPLELAPGETLTIYMRVTTGSSMQLPLTLWAPEAFQVYEQSDLLFQGIYYGIAVAMILYHCFVFIALRERAFLYYLGYITAMPLFLATLGGLSYQYLWPQATWWNNQLLMIFLHAVVIFGSFFTVRFLSIGRHSHPIIHGTILTVAGVAALIVLAALVIPFAHIVLPSILLAFIACSLMLTVGVVRLLEGDFAARYYTLAWCFMLFGGIVLALNKLALVPNNVFTQNAVQVGSALGVILLSIAIADRLNKEKQTALEAQQMALREEKNARLAQAETLKIQEEANTKLEERVRERTEELETANAKLREFSTTDSLTGLKTRGYFEEAFMTYCVEAFRYQQSLSLLVMDIDHFKSFNDTYGHLVGDQCLRVVAETMASVVTRSPDLLARYGGEEFVAVLPDTTAEGARCVAERIRKKMASAPFQVSDERITVTLSIGVTSRIPGNADMSQQLFEEADRALYQAKRADRNQVVVFDPEGSEPA